MRVLFHRPNGLLRIALPAFALLLFSGAAGRSGAQPSGMLNDLTRPHTGKIVHFSTTDPGEANGDSRPIAPGQTFTLMDYHGTGIVRRFWLAISPYNNPLVQRQAILRCYWDGETEPSVECPVNDFFGVGFGERRDYVSMPLSMTSGGTNCYWPMPFRKSARITLENRSNVLIDGFYFNIDAETQRSLPKDTLYFHAQFRRTTTQRGKPVTLLETTGRGQYVGTVLSMQMLRGRGLGFLEGDEEVWVDGESKPSIKGTGTEDYFNSGWYFTTGPYSAPFHGCPLKDEPKARISAYRWHIPDPIPFTHALKFTIQHGGSNDVIADYCSVAYWYQTHPHAKFPPLPADLLPTESAPVPHIAGMIEGEDLVPTAKTTDGTAAFQDLTAFPDDWSGLAQLFWTPKHIGAVLTLTVNAPKAGEYALIGYFTQAADYGQVRFAVNGQTLGSFDGYSPVVKPSGPISLGRAAFQAGPNTVTLETTGKAAASAGFYVGLDGFILKP